MKFGVRGIIVRLICELLGQRMKLVYDLGRRLVFNEEVLELRFLWISYQ